MRLLILILLLLTSLQSFGQGRFGLDISSRFNGANITLNYHHLFANKLILSGGFNFGGNGQQVFELGDSKIEQGEELNSPFANVNEPFQDTSGIYPSLVKYRTNANSVLFTLGVGLIRELSENNSIRGHLVGRVGTGHSNLFSTYRSANAETRPQISVNSYLTAALSLEFFYAIRLSDRMALYMGAKVPYYFQVSPSTFTTDKYRDLLFGFEPELSVGFTVYPGRLEKKD